MNASVKGLILTVILLFGCILSSGCIGVDFLKGKAKDAAVEQGEKGADHLDEIWVKKMEDLGITALNYDTNENGKLEINEMAYFTYALNRANQQKAPEDQDPWWMMLFIGLMGGAGTMTPMRKLYMRLLKMITGEAKAFVGIDKGAGST